METFAKLTDRAAGWLMNHDDSATAMVALENFLRSDAGIKPELALHGM